MSAVAGSTATVRLAVAALGDEVLAVTLALPNAYPPTDVMFRARGRRLDARWRRLRDDLILATVHSGASRGLLDEVVVSCRDDHIESIPIRRLDLEPASLLRPLIELSRETRREALQFLSQGAPSRPDTVFDSTMAGLKVVLRDRLDVSLGERGETRAVALDGVVACGDHAFYLRGWIRDTVAKPRKVLAVTPHGDVVGLLREGAWRDLPLVDAYFGDGAFAARGFSCLIETAGHPLTGNWLVELHDSAGAVESLEVAASEDLAAGRELILRDLVGDPPPPQAIADRAVAALERIQRRVAQPVVGSIYAFGSVPTIADVSMVVAAAEDPMLLEHHLAAYAGDPELDSIDLVFVISSTGSEAALPNAAGLHEIYGLSFRLVVVDDDATGLAAAANAGVRSAVGQFIALVRGGVIPAAPGWLGRLLETYHAHPERAAVGGTVLSPEGRITQAGVDLAIVGGSAVPRSRDAGLPRRALFSTPYPVDAVEGCVLVAADALSGVGGLGGTCLDNRSQLLELCLRLQTVGGTWCVPTAEFYDCDPSAASRQLAQAVGRYDSLVLAKLLSVPDAATAWVEALVTEPESGLRSALLRPPTELEAVGGHGLTVSGHALATDGPVRISVRFADVELAFTDTDMPTPRVAEAHPDLAHAASSGFSVPVSLLGLPRHFELAVDAEAGSGERTPVGVVRGARRPLTTGFNPRFQPLFVTTLGRTGSSWLMLLLDQHPELVAYLPFRFEPRVASYWLAIARALTQPRSYLQAISPELHAGHWWLGDERTAKRAAAAGERRITDWLGGPNAEAVVAFAQERIEALYTEVAGAAGKSAARFFVEKRMPDALNDRLAAELYSSGREIFLVRDFRDMACSALSFGARRGEPSFGRELVSSDNAYFKVLRSYALGFLGAWRNRRESSILLRYEDLILDPHKQLARVFSYLGVDDATSTVGDILNLASQTELGGQEGHRTASSPLASIGRWRRDLSDELQQIALEMLSDLLDEFGYPIDGGTVDGGHLRQSDTGMRPDAETQALSLHTRNE